MSQQETSGLVFQQASDEQLDLVWTLNAEAWAAPISTEAHVVRERFLSQQRLTGDSWRTFVLHWQKDEIIASCEAFEKEILICDRNGFRKERGYGIASVYTNPKYRRRKMANILLMNVAKWMDGEGNGTISVLYSDIGKTYYEKLGWTPCSTRQLVLESGADLCENNKFVLPGLHLLKDEHIEDLCKQDLEALEKEFAQPSKQDDRIRVAFTPTAHQIDWHLVREDYMAKALLDREKSPVRGAVSESRRAWLIWHFDLVEKKVKVQRIVLLDKDERERNVKEVAALLRFAQRQAKACGINHVIVWNPCDEIEQAGHLLADKFEGTRAIIEDRDSSIPALRRRNEEPTDEIIWEHNEYYAWC